MVTIHKLSPRSLKVLEKLIEYYIRDGQPVGSRTLAQDSSLMLSSATIRNIMADLEAAGYLQSPHISAGRIPTIQGYRLFVDNFITIQKPATKEIEELRGQLGGDCDAMALVNKASSLLSDITQLVGIVTLPKHHQMILKLVEFLPLTEKRVLVILVFNDDEVQNRVISTDRHYTSSELEQAGNYLTHHFLGKNLYHVRDGLLEIMRKDRHHLDQIIQTVMDIAEKTQSDEQEQDYVLAGESNLFNAVDESHYHRLRSLFEVFAQKHDILYLLDQVIRAKSMQIFIGEESGHKVFDDCSLVMAPYSKNGKVVGVLGVIGPTRMCYNKVVSAVDITAKLLSQALNIDE